MRDVEYSHVLQRDELKGNVTPRPTTTFKLLSKYMSFIVPILFYIQQRICGFVATNDSNLYKFLSRLKCKEQDGMK